MATLCTWPACKTAGCLDCDEAISFDEDQGDYTDDEAARHMEELQAAKDAIARPWQPMKTAPKDGTTVLVLLEGSDVPKAVKWCEADHFIASDGGGWYMTWDGHKIQPHEGPRYWMHCPDDPDDGEPEDA